MASVQSILQSILERDLPHPFQTVSAKVQDLLILLTKGEDSQHLPADQRLTSLESVRVAAITLWAELADGHLDRTLPWYHRRNFREFRLEIGRALRNLERLRGSDPQPVYSNAISQAKSQILAALESFSPLRAWDSTSWLGRANKYLLLTLVPAFLSLLAGVYFASRSGFWVDSAEMHVPFNISAHRNGDVLFLELPEREVLHFVRDFSPHYFRRPTDFASRYIEASRHPGITHRVKLDIVNAQRIGTTFLSNVQIQATLIQSRSFPWHHLKCTPDLLADVRLSDLHTSNTISETINHKTSYSLRNQGVGPALSVSLTCVTADGTRLANDHYSIIHDDPVEVLLPEPGDPVSPWPLRFESLRRLLGPREFTTEYLSEPWKIALVDGSPALLTPLYAKLPMRPITSDSEQYFEHEFSWYEVINTVDDLSRFTDVSYQKNMHLKMTYKSLSGQHYEYHRTDPMPVDWCYYERVPEIVEFDPRIARPAPLKFSTVAAAPSGAAPAAFLSQFVPPLYDPKGVDHVIVEGALNAAQLRDGEMCHVTMMVDKFINPRGTISAYIRIDGAVCAKWDWRILINGAPIGSARIETIAPEVLTFPLQGEERLREVERLEYYYRHR